MPLPITDPGYKHNNEYFANMIKKHIPARVLAELIMSPMGAEAEYWRLVNIGTIPDALGNFRANTPTAAAGANAGTSPPVPVVSTNSKDFAGNITFGTGTTPAAGSYVTVTFGGGAYATAPFVSLTPSNAATAPLQPYVVSVSTTAFVIGLAVTGAASQANTVYSVAFRVN
jgi:hypothetical protein